MFSVGDGENNDKAIATPAPKIKKNRVDQFQACILFNIGRIEANTKPKK